MTKRNWQSLKIKDYPIKIIDGDRGSNYPSKEEFSEDGFCLFLNTGNVTLNGFDFSKSSFISKEKHEQLRKGHLIRGDVVLTTRGTIGNCGYYGPQVEHEVIRINSGMLILRPDTEKLDRLFFYQLIKSNVFQQQAELFRYGAAQPQLPIGTLNYIRLPLPPLPIQKKIAGVLSAYDDLIEANLKRIKLLEEMAQITYEEWFVRRHFPNHETTPINSETGLPEGWCIKQIKDFGAVVTGKTPSTADQSFFGQDVPFIKTPDMHGLPYVLSTEQSLSIEGANSQEKKYLPMNSLMVSCIGTVGVVALTSRPSQTNQQINSIVFDDSRHAFFMFAFAKRLSPLLDGLGSNGATMTNVNKSKFEQIEVQFPGDELISLFNNISAPSFESILNLLKQNALLREARDLLLPRLMTGLIDIDDYLSRNTSAAVAA